MPRSIRVVVAAAVVYWRVDGRCATSCRRRRSRREDSFGDGGSG